MALPTASDNPFPSILITEGTEPAAPAAGKQRLYIDSTTHELMLTNSAGTEKAIPKNVMTTTGDTIVAGASGVPARLAIGSTNALYQVVAGTPAWTLLAAGTAVRTAGDLTTSSSTFIDATGMSVAITTGARRCLIVVQANGKHSGVGNVCLDIDIDGSRQGQAYGLSNGGNASAANYPLSFSFITAALSAASHTFKLQWRTDGGATATLYASTTVTPLSMQVIELPV